MKVTGLKIALATALTAASAAALPVLGGALPAQAASTSRFVVTCGGSGVSRPLGIVVRCRTAATILVRVKWTSWGSTASGHATAMINNCKPTCLHGKFGFYPVNVTLEQPLAWAGHAGKSYYSKLVLGFTASRPVGFAATRTYVMPGHATY